MGDHPGAKRGKGPYQLARNVRFAPKAVIPEFVPCCGGALIARKAREQADKMFSVGDIAGFHKWNRVTDAIKDLERKCLRATRCDGGSLQRGLRGETVLPF